MKNKDKSSNEVHSEPLYQCSVSNSNIMKDFVFEERIKKLEELNKDERIKMVWMWCKQNVITLNQFKQLISYCC